MSESLFIFLARGVAADLKSYRPGARHALMLYAKGAEITSARLAAVEGAESKGWTFVDVQREKKIDADPSGIDDVTLRAAVEDACETGFSIVVYGQELTLDS